MQMDEDFCARKDGKKNSARNSIEIPDDEDVEEVELSPVETIVWDCCEVRIQHIFEDELTAHERWLRWKARNYFKNLKS